MNFEISASDVITADNTIIMSNIIFYRSYSYCPVGNPPSTPVIIVFVFGFSFLLRNRSLPAFDAIEEKKT